MNESTPATFPIIHIFTYYYNNRLGVNIRDIIKPIRIPIEKLAFRTIAIDGYNALYQFLSIVRGEGGEYLKDRQGRITSHLSGLFYRNINLIELGIKPIYIFDGKPPILKSREINRRIKVKMVALKKYNLALKKGDLAEARKYAQSAIYLKDYMIEDTKRILDLLGIPWLDAPSEGEATAAHLTNIGIATDTASQDFDALLFGSKRLVRNVTISGRRKLPGRSVYVSIEPEEIELRKLLQRLDVSHEQLIDIGILVGTDFNPNGFKRIGPATALKLIKKYGKLEAINKIKNELRKIDYESIRLIFLEPDVAVPTSKISWKKPDNTGILNYLCDERSFSEERVNRALKRLDKLALEKSENLEKWF
jgi:flap endonuclease-1